jgi:thioredoxin reductase (NADPH)
VTGLEPAGEPRKPAWLVHTTRATGPGVLRARAVVVATGYFGRPNRLGVPGEELPHVRHGYVDGHYAWRQQVVVVGGANSAVDAALDMYRAGGDVTIVHFGPSLDANVKPWVRPEIEARIREGKIHAIYESRVTAIGADYVSISGPGGERRVPATQVYEMTGYLPETGLLELVGVPIDPDSGVPAHDPRTMATPVPGVYLAGVIASGFQANRIFIENGRDHGDMIVADLQRPF